MVKLRKKERERREWRIYANDRKADRGSDPRRRKGRGDRDSYLKWNRRGCQSRCRLQPVRNKRRGDVTADISRPSLSARRGDDLIERCRPTLLMEYRIKPRVALNPSWPGLDEQKASQPSLQLPPGPPSIYIYIYSYRTNPVAKASVIGPLPWKTPAKKLARSETRRTWLCS